MPRTKYVPSALLMIAALIAFVLISGSLASAQGGDGDDSDTDALLAGVTIRPVEDILEGPLEITGFASDGTATLPLTTRVPVACTIVYGTTPAFGHLTLDQDMAGGTHSDHSPLLSGLEPETTYYFRVQGTDDDGIIYLSETMTFTTPAFEAEEVTNLLSPKLGAQVIGYSSAFGGAAPDANWGVLSAFDGSPNSAWSSAGDGNDAWVEVQLAQRARIDRVEFWTRTMPNDTAQISAFTITTEDGTVYGPYELPDASQAYTFDVALEAETLRFDVVDSNGGNTGAVEIAVYGEFIE